MKTWHALTLILALILASFFIGRITAIGERNSQNQAIIALNDTISSYTVTIDGLKHTVYEKDQVILSKQQAISAGLFELDRIKKLGLRKASQVTRLEAQLIAARDSILIRPVVEIHDTTFLDAGEGKIYARIPLQWSYSDQYLDLTTGIDKDKLGWFNLKADVPATITLGSKRTGVFKSSPVVTLDTPSPYLVLSDIEVINLQQNKWYDNWLLPVGGGAVGGVILWEMLQRLAQ